MPDRGEELREEIEELVGFDGRAPGSDAERRAASHLAERLREDGRDAELESCPTWPGWPLGHVAHAVIAIVGSVISVSAPVVGVTLVLIAALLTWLDGTGTAAATRRLLGRRASQNVVSAGNDDKPGTLVLVAHYDSGPLGALFGGRLEERRAALGRRIRRPIGRLEPLFWAEVLVLFCCLLRVVGVHGTLVNLVQFLPTVVLIVAVPLLIDAALSPTAPGANDNASGVVAALELGRRHGGHLDHFDVWILLTGAQEAMSDGMRAFLRRHKGDLAKGQTVFLNLDEVGAGTVRYTIGEGPILAVKSHAQLVGICEELAEDEDDEEAGAKPLVNRTLSDGGMVRRRGYPGITVTCRNALDYVPTHHQATDTPRRVEQAALDRALGFCDELVERIDAQLGPDVARAGDDALSESD